MSATLKSKALRGAFWSLLERGGQQGIHFVVMIVLARLLAPEQFGLVGMLAVFIEVATVFIDSGFGAALIQRQKPTEVDISSIFYFNVLIGLLAAGLLCAAAPWIAAFYDQPILTPLTRALSLTLVFNSFAGVHVALLSKRIDFKTQLKVGVAATSLSGAVGIALALCGFGVWSLVAQFLAHSLFRTALLWRLNTWRPRPVFRGAALREMFGFGSHLLATSLLNRIFENIYLVVIGKLFSATHLGLYSGAKRMEHLATINIASVVAQVAYPVFSTIQDDPARLKRSMRKAMMALAFVQFPVMVGLALLARPLVLLLLTAKWSAAIPWLQLLCVAGLSYPFLALHFSLLKAQGRSDLCLRMEALKRVLIVVMIAITYRWGVTGMIWGQIVMSVLSYYINSFYTSRLLHYPLKEQLADLAPYAVTSVLMGMSLYGIRLVPSPDNALGLVAQVLLGGAVYLALSSVFRLSAWVEMTSMSRTIREYA